MDLDEHNELIDDASEQLAEIRRLGYHYGRHQRAYLLRSPPPSLGRRLIPRTQHSERVRSAIIASRNSSRPVASSSTSSSRMSRLLEPSTSSSGVESLRSSRSASRVTTSSRSSTGTRKTKKKSTSKKPRKMSTRSSSKKNQSKKVCIEFVGEDGLIQKVIQEVEIAMSKTKRKTKGRRKVQR